MNGPFKQEERRVRSSRKRWATAGVAAAVAALAPTAVSTVPAEGTVVDMSPGHNVTVFHNIDFVAVFGHATGDSVTVEVRRNGVVIGSATGAAAGDAPEIGLEVNHGPEGTPVAGDCWQGHTPDIRPGDRIRVNNATAGTTDTVVVDNIAFTGRPRELRNGDIVVPFRAYRANGNAIPATRIDSAEFRAASNNQLRFEGNAVKVERRPGAAPGQLWQRYPKPFRPARNRDNLTQDQIRRALLGDGHATGIGHVAPLPQEGMLFDGLEDTPGPALGCNNSPSARWQVSGVSPKLIRPANRTQLFKARGRTFNSERVMVTLTDRDAGEPVRTVQKRATVTGNTWTVSFRPSQLGALDGQFRVSSLHTFNGGQIGGPVKFATRNLR